MAVPAVHPELFGMDLVGEGNWLGRLVPHPRELRCEIIPNARAHSTTGHQDAEQDFDREPITPPRKDVGHARGKIGALIQKQDKSYVWLDVDLRFKRGSTQESSEFVKFFTSWSPF